MLVNVQEKQNVYEFGTNIIYLEKRNANENVYKYM